MGTRKLARMFLQELWRRSQVAPRCPARRNIITLAPRVECQFLYA